jgi:DDE superfamily endonuclease
MEILCSHTSSEGIQGTYIVKKICILRNFCSLYSKFCVDEKIVWEDHNFAHNNNENGHTSWVLSVDGTHCLIREPRTVPDKDWYSHKPHKPCVAYEIAVSLKESKIAWVSGPHKAGETDLVIIRKADGLLSRIPDGFKIIGDKGYIGEEKVSVNK